MANGTDALRQHKHTISTVRGKLHAAMRAEGMSAPDLSDCGAPQFARSVGHVVMVLGDVADIQLTTAEIAADRELQQREEVRADRHQLKRRIIGWIVFGILTAAVGFGAAQAQRAWDGAMRAASPAPPGRNP